MKGIFLTLLLCCLTCLGVSAQTILQATPPPDADVLMIQTPDTRQDALGQVSQALTRQGYRVEKVDRQLMTLLIQPKAVSSSPTPILLTLRARATAGPESILTLQGDYTVPGKKTTGVARYAADQRSGSRVAFDHLQKAAAAYPAGKLLYGKD